VQTPLPTRLILVRHAQTLWNLEHRYAGDSEVGLAPQSVEQIALLTKRLRHEQVDAIYASTITRCLLTIEPTAEIHHRRIIKREELRERNLGEWEGRIASEIHPAHAGYHFPESAYDGSFRVPDSEPLDELEDRIRSVLREIVEAHPGQSVVVATHAGVIWMIQARIILNPPKKLHWTMNCAVVTLEAEHGHYTLKAIEEQDSYVLPKALNHSND
jgi:broad specificity phosphatase PhoE